MAGTWGQQGHGEGEGKGRDTVLALSVPAQHANCIRTEVALPWGPLGCQGSTREPILSLHMLHVPTCAHSACGRPLLSTGQ